MIHFSFVPIESLDAALLNDLESRYESEEVISLGSVDELSKLIKLYGAALKESPFSNLADVTESWLITDKLQKLSETDFELAYQNWLHLTERDNNTDEFGQLTCFNGSVDKLNQATHLVVLQNAI